MEVAGLVVGVVALASLFKDCVDLYACVSTARSMDRDYKILDTMLDVERTILLQWADRVRLLREDYHPLLDKPGVCVSVSKVLSAVQGLLNDGRDLQQRYGLRPAEDDESTGVAPVMSGPRMAGFLRDFEAMSLRRGKQREASMRKRFRWVVRDKDSFEGLLRQLSYFNSKLNDLIPDTQQRVILMVQRDIEDLRSLDKMRLVLEATTSREETVAAVARQAIVEDCQSRVLQALWYRTMDLRKDQVTAAHSETFRWALEPKQSHTHWDDLPGWLEGGRGLYWISGKAGSGKSTLMKYLYEHPRTRQYLKTWSGDRKLTTTSFFFWSLGLVDQRSQQGLLRALLYNILHSEPSLIPDILPGMWKDAQASDSHKVSTPPLAEMEAAFKRLTVHCDDMNSYCFFIDGLDEFAGRCEDTIGFLTSLTKSPNIKIVVSSRPIPSCVEAFQETPQLRLHDLTRDDIQSYVRATIATHRYMRTLSSTSAQSADRIVHDVVEKASGVFLWVVLACRSVLEGFAACDHLSDIQQRIDELPPEIQDLFSHILGRIDTRYREQAAKILRICYNSRLSEETEPLQCLGLALVDDGRMNTDRASFTSRVTSVEAKARCEALEGRLRSRCCGLLEIRRPSEESLQDGDGACFCRAQGEEGHDALVDSTVEFMHRTVFEFLDQPEVWSSSCLQMGDEGFDATATLAHLSLELAHFTLETNEYMVRAYLKDLLIYGRRADTSAPDLIAPVLLKFEDMLRDGLSRPNSMSLDDQQINRFASGLEGDGGIPFAFLFALEAGMENFASSYAELNDIPLFPPNIERPLLYHVLCGHLTGILSAQRHIVPISTLRYLLQSGCDPNEEVLLPGHSVAETPWKHWLNQMSCVDMDSALVTAKVTDIFIRNNADPGVAESWMGETLPQKIKRLLVDFGTRAGRPSVKDRRYVSQMGRELLRLLQRGGAAKRRLEDREESESESGEPPRKK